MQRPPRILFFVFGDAIGKLARIAKSRHIDSVRTRAAEVQENQLQRAAQGAVSASHIAEHVLPAGEAEFVANGPVDDNERRGEMSRCLDSMRVETFVAGGAH